MKNYVKFKLRRWNINSGPPPRHWQTQNLKEDIVASGDSVSGMVQDDIAVLADQIWPVAAVTLNINIISSRVL